MLCAAGGGCAVLGIADAVGGRAACGIVGVAVHGGFTADNVGFCGTGDHTPGLVQLICVILGQRGGI